MKEILIDLLITAGKTIGGKYLENRLENLFRSNLVFTKVMGVYHYSHYVGQNHVREGGEKKIYQVSLSLSVFNPSKTDRVIRELTLYSTIEGKAYPFHLFDLEKDDWQENYRVDRVSVSSFRWQAAPEGHGITIWLGAPGIIPFTDDDTISLHLTYRNEKGRIQQIPLTSRAGHRLPKEQIAS